MTYDLTRKLIAHTDSLSLILPWEGMTDCKRQRRNFKGSMISQNSSNSISWCKHPKQDWQMLTWRRWHRFQKQDRGFSYRARIAICWISLKPSQRTQNRQRPTKSILLHQTTPEISTKAAVISSVATILQHQWKTTEISFHHMESPSKFQQQLMLKITKTAIKMTLQIWAVVKMPTTWWTQGKRAQRRMP